MPSEVSHSISPSPLRASLSSGDDGQASTLFVRPMSDRPGALGGSAAAPVADGTKFTKQLKLSTRLVNALELAQAEGGSLQPWMQPAYDQLWRADLRTFTFPVAHHDGVGFEVLPEYFSAPGARPSKYLVRAEWEELYDHFEARFRRHKDPKTGKEEGGYMIWGQPGIGTHRSSARVAVPLTMRLQASHAVSTTSPPNFSSRSKCSSSATTLIRPFSSPK